MIFAHGIKPTGVYFDVFGYIPPDQDFNREHPSTRTDWMRERALCMRWARQNVGLVGTEAAADWTIPQDWASYSPREHAVWDQLYTRQTEMLKGRACEAFRRGIEHLRLSEKGIPNFEDLSERLGRRTGWQVVAVPGLVPDDVFF